MCPVRGDNNCLQFSILTFGGIRKTNKATSELPGRYFLDPHKKGNNKKKSVRTWQKNKQVLPCLLELEQKTWIFLLVIVADCQVSCFWQRLTIFCCSLTSDLCGLNTREDVLHLLEAWPPASKIIEGVFWRAIKVSIAAITGNQRWAAQST